MGISLYRQYRPQKFSEVAGQPAAVDVLIKSIERSRIGHAYLFSGPRGCGKTTVARLLAKALNCLAPLNGYEPCCECKNCLAIATGESLDVIEIDGASNNSVDEVRELKSHVTLAPFSSQFKIYIIDEVHMLSISAFNALLKTLEEPPAYVVFVLATTEAHKVPVTIRSRCQHIPFHRIGTQQIYDRLDKVCSLEAVEYQPEALWEIARQADGALRDALSMLEQVANLGKEGLLLSDVEAVLGQGSRSSLERWFSGWHKGDMQTFCALDRMLAGGASPQRFLEELFSLSRNLWLTAKWGEILAELDVSDQEKEYLRSEAPLWQPAELESLMRFLAELLPQARLGLRIDVLSGLLMAKMTQLKSGLKNDLDLRGEQVKLQPSHKTVAPPAPEETVRPVSRKEPEPALPEPHEIVPAASVAAAVPLDSSGWKSCPEELWEEALRALHENEFLLYCALLDVRPFLDEAASPNRLILDVPDRYSYEVSRLDRNRLALKKVLTRFWGSLEIVLHHGSLWTSCESKGRKDEISENKRERQPENPEQRSFENSIPQEDFESSAIQSESKEVRPVGGVPFDGLVREVTRWMRGDVVLVRRGVEEDDVADGVSVEE